MSTAGLDPLTASTRSLLADVESRLTRSLWFQREGELLERLDQIAAANEPAAIIDLMPFGLRGNAAIRTKVRSIILDLSGRLTIEMLLQLDELMRRSWISTRNWHFLTPDAIHRMGHTSDADRLYIALTTCHHNGYVRAEALSVLCRDSSEMILPFVALRLVDWVHSIRAFAETQFNKRLAHVRSEALLDVLVLTDRLALNSRFPVEISKTMGGFLKAPVNAEALELGMKAPSRMLRRRCVRLAMENPEFDSRIIIKRALGDEDVIIRKWAFTVGLSLLPSVADLTLQAAEDPYPPIRRLALEAIAAKPSPRPEEFQIFLMDRAASLRRACQSIFSSKLGYSPTEFYRAAMKQVSGGRADVRILGLAECGNRGDSEVIVKELASTSVRVRRAAIRGLYILGAIDTNGLQSTVLGMISSDVPSVAADAARALLLSRKLEPWAIWTEALTNPDHRVGPAILRLFSTVSRWKQLRVYLSAAASINSNLSAGSVDLLARWMQQYNNTFAPPSATDIKLAVKLLQEVDHRLPASLRDNLKFTLRTAI